MREILSFNSDWRFYLGDDVPIEARGYGTQQLIGGEDRVWQKGGNHGLSRPGNPHVAAWRRVDLPHDYAIEGDFTPSIPYTWGSLEHGKAWYVKEFVLPESDRGRRIHVEFDGVYRNCMVWLNGHFVGRYLSGYTSFGFDLTDICRFGEANALAVFVDATENELWSYEGGGIYRGVRLVKTAPVHIPQWGVYVTTGGADEPGRADVAVTVANASYESAACEVVARVLSSDGALLAEAAPVAVETDAFGAGTARARLEVASPELWSVDRPVMHTLVAEVRRGGETVDRMEVPFGFRYFHFDADQGFFLNGEPIKLKGTCCHQDSAGVGTAVPPALQAWRVRRLKDMGCNAIRTSHNPPDPALLDACDRLGMLVMDEHRMSGASDEILGQLSDLIRRDRNHPSVILWSLGNEEMSIQGTQTGLNIFRRMQHLAHELDPSRPTTYAMNCDWIDLCDFHAENGFRFDVFGTNYRSGQRSENYDDFHAKYPDWPMLGSETGGSGSVRGLYEPHKSTIPVRVRDRWLEREEGWRDEAYKYFASAYGGTFTPWGYSVEETWQDCANRPHMAGTFFWTGFDYRGETFPYEWPAVITSFGILDLCGFYKEVAHYLRAWWRPDDPHIFLMPHWDWHGREGEPIAVWCYSNAREVELILNGESLGRKAMPENFRLEWSVPWVPGKIEARGYDADGAEVARTYRRTTSAPCGIELSTDETRIAADGEDVAVVNVAVVDREGDTCPRADDLVEFEVTGPARILGVGNGNPMSHEPDKANYRHAFHGLCQVILQSSGEAGVIMLTARSRQLEESQLRIEAI